jgi:hypothetical protein
MLCSVLYSITTCDKNVEFRVKPDLVILNGQQERHPEGAYYLEWRENGRRVRLSVGNDAADASARRQRKKRNSMQPTTVSLCCLRMATTGTGRSQQRSQSS